MSSDHSSKPLCYIIYYLELLYFRWKCQCHGAMNLWLNHHNISPNVLLLYPHSYLTLGLLYFCTVFCTHAHVHKESYVFSSWGKYCSTFILTHPYGAHVTLLFSAAISQKWTLSHTHTSHHTTSQGLAIDLSTALYYGKAMTFNRDCNLY